MCGAVGWAVKGCGSLTLEGVIDPAGGGLVAAEDTTADRHGDGNSVEREWRRPSGLLAVHLIVIDLRRVFGDAFAGARECSIMNAVWAASNAGGRFMIADMLTGIRSSIRRSMIDAVCDAWSMSW